MTEPLQLRNYRINIKIFSAGEETTDYYSVAGRIMAMRNSGMFIDLMDSSGKFRFLPIKIMYLKIK